MTIHLLTMLTALLVTLEVFRSIGRVITNKALTTLVHSLQPMTTRLLVKFLGLLVECRNFASFAKSSLVMQFVELLTCCLVLLTPYRLVDVALGGKVNDLDGSRRNWS